VSRSEAWNLGICSVFALGIRKMKLTSIEFVARWICLFHIDFQLAGLPSSIGTLNFIRVLQVHRYGSVPLDE
jgi:hypothetical protein